ncbi:MAG: PKD domain-containing protein [Bacteroidetes bacterium]|nr:PKD domain-containing protein [Bacteroidota bacterium]
MKNIYTHGWRILICLIIAFIQTNTEAYASHAQGGDLTYTCLGGNNYRLRLAFYRDCSGVSAPSNVTIDISSINCAQNLTATLNPIPGTGQDVTPICPNMLTVCNGGQNPGVQEWIYEGNVQLPQACTDWVFSFTLCCRNAAINTIVNPGGQNIYIESHLNNVDAPCNSSPTFSNIPVPFICSGQSYCFNHGAVDPDGDSLSYTLVNPATGPTTFVTYIAPYSALQPVLSSPAVSFNNVTGDICMNPTQIIVTVMAVRVDEWRNGVWIGSVVRDIQLHTINCTNNLPTITGINGGNTYSASVCAGNSLSFYINSSDPDAGDNLTVTWNGAIPGATFTTTGGPTPTGTFSWTPSAVNISNTPYCFTITVTDDACPYTGSQTFAFCITVTGFALNITSQSANCGASNGSASVSVVGGNGPYNYIWSPNGGNNPNANGLTAGNYSVVVTDATGCTSTASTTISPGTSNANVNATVVDVPCYSGNNGSASLTVNGGQGPYTYLWSNNTTASSINGLTAGTYSITVLTASGCISTLTITITQPASPLNTAASIVGNISCFGGNNAVATVNASGGTGPYVYSWNSSPSQSTATASSLTAGLYSVLVTDANGCVSSGTVNITEPQMLIGTVNVTSVTCNGGINGSAQIILSGGTPPYNTSWNTNPIQFGNSAVNLVAGNYTATTTDANGCIITPPAIITQPAPLSAGIANSQNVSCNGGNNGSASVNASGGTAPYNYIWNTNPTQYNAAAVGVIAGNYTVTVTDAHGCATVSTVFISQPATFTISPFAGDTVCPGLPALVGVIATGGTAPFAYSWNNNLGNNSSHTVYPMSSTNYVVSATDANGCTSASTNILIDVYELTLLNLSMTAASNLCAGATATVGASTSGNTGSLTWIWNNQNWTNGGPFTVQPNNTTTYQVTVSNQCGMTVSNNTTISVNPIPAVTLQPQVLSGCDRVAMIFNDTNQNNTGDFYSWNFGDSLTGTGNNISHNYEGSGTYNVTVTITSIYGCIGTGSTIANVIIYASPHSHFEVTDNVVSELEPTFQFENDCSMNTIGWQWDFGDNTTDNIPSPAHTYAQKGTYNVRLIATSNGGCADTTEMPVIVEPEFTFYVPNAFTPNGDGNNDVFFAYGSEINSFSMMVFDRWGNLIFTSNDINTGWDGRAKNGSVIAQQDVYVYKILVQDFRGHSHRLTGSFSLLK